MTRIIDGKYILFVSNEILQEVFFVMIRPKFNVLYLSSNLNMEFTERYK